MARSTCWGSTMATDPTRKTATEEHAEARVADHDRLCVFCHEVVRERDKTRVRVWEHGKINAAAHQECVDAC